MLPPSVLYLVSGYSCGWELPLNIHFVGRWTVDGGCGFESGLQGTLSSMDRHVNGGPVGRKSFCFRDFRCKPIFYILHL